MGAFTLRKAAGGSTLRGGDTLRSGSSAVSSGAITFESAGDIDFDETYLAAPAIANTYMTGTQTQDLSTGALRRT